MLDLTVATNCINRMKERGTYRGHKIGRIVSGGTYGLSEYKDGQVVLFREELEPFSVEMGEYLGIEQNPRGTVTIEIPHTEEDILKNREKGSLITTFGTTIGVHHSYVEEIRI